MSRRHSARTLDYLDDLNHEVEQWWDDLATNDIPEDWQTAWADTTLDVVNRVWSKQGRRLYAVHKDTLLRDDLHDWLIVRAQEISNQYIPDANAHDPQRYWAAYLWRCLNEQSQWHFNQYVGQKEAAREAHSRGIMSIQALTDSDGDSWTARHALHGNDVTVQDPYVILARIDDLGEQVRLAERYLRDRRDTTYTTQSETCLIVGCDRPRHRKQPYCNSHYQHERNLWREEGEPCCIPGCDNPITVASLKLCNQHKAKYRRGALTPEEFAVIPNAQPRPVCSADGCDNPSYVGGLCSADYQRMRRDRRKAS